MKSHTDNAIKIMALLNTATSLNADDMAHKLGLSVLVVKESISQLIQAGAPIQLSSSGYYLKQSCQWLNADEIYNSLNKDFLQNIALDIKAHAICSSTNTLLLNEPITPGQIKILMAETQSHGYGRFNRHWVSPFGQNIYLSLAQQFNTGSIISNGLSIAIGTVIVSTLAQLGLTDLKLKWPNDILINHQKLAGILIESKTQTNGRTKLVVGIGINVNQTPSDPNLDQTCTSLYESGGQKYNRNVIIALLIQNLLPVIQKFSSCGLAAFMTTWQHYDYLYGQNITVNQDGITLLGEMIGIDNQGALLLKLANGEIKTLHSGNTSLIKKKY